MELIIVEARLRGSYGIRYFKQPGVVIRLSILVRGLFDHVLHVTQIDDSGKVGT
jgi:hypothetical protein